MTNLEDKAWRLYCADTQGSMHVADFWWEVPLSVQEKYINLSNT
jgi:hypothetical protein